MRIIRQFAFSVCFAAIVSVAPFAHADDIKKVQKAFAEGDSGTALAMLRPLAEGGNQRAQGMLAILYAQGEWVPQNHDEAIRLINKLADKYVGFAKEIFIQSYPAALYERYSDGITLPDDPGTTDKKKIEKYIHAAKQGDVEAQIFLAVKSEEDYFRDRNEENAIKALQWMHMAAEQGNADAQNILAGYYAGRLGSTVYYEKAEEWNRKAAEQGHFISMMNLAAMYEYGRLGYSDDRFIVEWNRKKAMEWRRKATIYGDPARGPRQMANYYSDGLKTEQDFMAAYIWHQIAIKYPYWEYGVMDPARISAIRVNLSAEQIAEGERLVDKCVESGYEACPYHIKLPGLRGVNG